MIPSAGVTTEYSEKIITVTKPCMVMISQIDAIYTKGIISIETINNGKISAVFIKTQNKPRIVIRTGYPEQEGDRIQKLIESKCT
jgi:hypothetical protein